MGCTGSPVSYLAGSTGSNDAAYAAGGMLLFQLKRQSRAPETIVQRRPASMLLPSASKAVGRMAVVRKETQGMMRISINRWTRVPGLATGQAIPPTRGTFARAESRHPARRLAALIGGAALCAFLAMTVGSDTADARRSFGAKSSVGRAHGVLVGHRPDAGLAGHSYKAQLRHVPSYKARLQDVGRSGGRDHGRQFRLDPAAVERQARRQDEKEARRETREAQQQARRQDEQEARRAAGQRAANAAAQQQARAAAKAAEAADRQQATTAAQQAQQQAAPARLRKIQRGKSWWEDARDAVRDAVR
jgi:hypothetical protein